MICRMHLRPKQYLAARCSWRGYLSIFVVQDHGELEVGQIYASKLHPALGGPITIDNLRPAGALAAMTIAAQAASFTLYNTTIPSVPAVRDVGTR